MADNTPIEPIKDGDGGREVREKLNEVIDKSNQYPDTPDNFTTDDGVTDPSAQYARTVNGWTPVEAGGGGGVGSIMGIGQWDLAGSSGETPTEGQVTVEFSGDDTIVRMHRTNNAGEDKYPEFWAVLNPQAAMPNSEWYLGFFGVNESNPNQPYAQILYGEIKGWRFRDDKYVELTVFGFIFTTATKVDMKLVPQTKLPTGGGDTAPTIGNYLGQYSYGAPTFDGYFSGDPTLAEPYISINRVNSEGKDWMELVNILSTTPRDVMIYLSNEQGRTACAGKATLDGPPSSEYIDVIFEGESIWNSDFGGGFNESVPMHIWLDVLPVVSNSGGGGGGGGKAATTIGRGQWNMTLTTDDTRAPNNGECLLVTTVSDSIEFIEKIRISDTIPDGGFLDEEFRRYIRLTSNDNYGYISPHGDPAYDGDNNWALYRITGYYADDVGSGTVFNVQLVETYYDSGEAAQFDGYLNWLPTLDPAGGGAAPVADALPYHFGLINLVARDGVPTGITGDKQMVVNTPDFLHSSTALYLRNDKVANVFSYMADPTMSHLEYVVTLSDPNGSGLATDRCSFIGKVGNFGSQRVTIQLTSPTGGFSDAAAGTNLDVFIQPYTPPPA